MFGAASSLQFCAFEPLLCKQYSSLPDPALIIVIIVNSIIVVTIIIMTFVRDIECIIIILAFTVIYVVYS